MLEFKKLGTGDYDLVREYFLKDNDRRIRSGEDLICDQLFGTTYMWREYYNTRFAECGDSVILRVSDGGTEMFTIPIGGDIEAALFNLKEYAHSVGMTMYFCFVSESDLHYFDDAFDIVFRCEEPDWFDYVYDKTAITDYPGKRYHGQKNFVNRFRKSNPDGRFVVVDSSNSALAKEYVAGWFSRYADHSLMSDAEEQAIYELLDGWDSFGMSGGFITSYDGIVGFTAGEIAGDTVFVHIEKAEHTLPGAYQFLSSEYLRSITDANVRYVNREEDMGIPGLRKAKTALHPVKLLKKYTLYCC